MKWEMDRHKWADLGEGGITLSERIAEFISACDPDRVRELFFLIEEAGVPVNGPMRVGVEAVSAFGGLLLTPLTCQRARLSLQIHSFLSTEGDTQEADRQGEAP
jgi:hypothetical protein